jgi:hypothetical protein
VTLLDHLHAMVGMVGGRCLPVRVYPSGSPCVTETYGLEKVLGPVVKYRHPQQLIATTTASSTAISTSPSGQGAGVHGAGKKARPVTTDGHLMHRHTNTAIVCIIYYIL